MDDVIALGSAKKAKTVGAESAMPEPESEPEPEPEPIQGDRRGDRSDAAMMMEEKARDGKKNEAHPLKSNLQLPTEKEKQKKVLMATKHLSCRECHADFTFSVQTQQFHDKMQYPPPARCKKCRDAKRVQKEGACHACME